MKVILFGGRGYLGQQFLTIYPDALTPSTDIADRSAVAEILDREKPDVVINCAGKTGRPNVDWCEDHKEETIHANVLGPLVLNEECSKRGVYWVHMSSGCIYEGDNEGKGFAEDNEPNFTGSFYSRSKIWSDQILSEFPVLILRIRMPFDDSLHPRSLITKIAKYQKVLDVRNSLTYLPDFLQAAKTLIERRRTGIFNLVNPGVISPFEIMTLYKEIVDPSHVIERLTLDHLSDVVKAGRSNCTLSTAKAEKEGVTLRPVDEAVRTALAAIARGKTESGALETDPSAEPVIC
ncbi:MAG TPA: sugar nucleotide-binding protein [Candidatus Peribacteraceae bacterium]|nr:sugar nucleotide-binding protein [Candidatus Peribacteraceae bacterium]